MTFIDDPVGATTAELSDELIFLIASVSTGEQRKYATDLFRHFARQVALESYRLGQKSMVIAQLPPPLAGSGERTEPADPAGDPRPSLQPSIPPSDDLSAGLIPPVRWRD